VLLRLGQIVVLHANDPHVLRHPDIDIAHEIDHDLLTWVYNERDANSPTVRRVPIYE
jgi:hypothetical protein